MIIILSSVAIATSIICLFIFADFKIKQKFKFTDYFINDFEICKKTIKLHKEFSNVVIDDFEERWKGKLSKRTLNLYIGKLLETSFNNQTI